MRSALVILAAGSGTRFGRLKQLEPVGPTGETLLEYSAYDAVRAGFDHVVLVIRRQTESAFRRRLDEGVARSVLVTYAHQSLEDLPGDFVPSSPRTRPWGTGHAVLAASRHVDGPFAVINADDFYGGESYEVLHGFLQRTAGRSDRLAVVGYRVGATLTAAGPVSRAVLRTDDVGHLSSVIELAEVWQSDQGVRYRDARGRVGALRGDELVSMNMWGLSRPILVDLEARFGEFLERSGNDAGREFILPEVVEDLVHVGKYKVDVLPGAGEWCGMTYLDDLERVRATIAALVRRGRYPRHLWG